MELLLRTVLTLSLGGSVLALLLLLLRCLFGRRLPSAFFYYAWLIVLLRFVLPLPGLIPGPYASAPAAAPVPVQAAPAAGAAAELPSALRPVSDVPPRTSPVLPPQVSTVEPSPSQAEARQGPDRDALWQKGLRLLSSLDFWGAVYLLGAGAAALHHFGGYLRFRRRLERTLRAPQEADLAALRRHHEGPLPLLRRSRAVPTPMLIGLRRPVILLPERSYSPEMLDGILRHELTHYRRGDIAFKWFAVLVSVLHWFNPLLRVLLREIDLACELSCDEHLLRRMGREEKRRYGELLLSLAADRALPRGVVAMSFTTEKRNLKERLIQIMTYKKAGKASLAILLIAILLLTGCAGALGPAVTEPVDTTPPDPAGSAAEAAEAAKSTQEAMQDAAASLSTLPDDLAEDFSWDPPSQEIPVKTVDELIAAIGPDRLVQLGKGEFDLAKATSYGEDTGNEYCYWAETFDGYELRLRNLSNMTILGDGAGRTQLLAEPRYANVLAFEACQGVSLISFTAGHTPAPGYCSGGVLNFKACTGVGIESCDLFGCGILGLSAANCQGLIANSCTIRECSYGAIQATGCYDVRFTGGVIKDCGVKADFNAFELLEVNATTGFALLNTEITGNSARIFLCSGNSLDVTVRGCDVHDNSFGEYVSREGSDNGEPVYSAWGGVFEVTGGSPVVDGCSFRDNELLGGGWYFNNDGDTNTAPCVNAEGKTLRSADLESMELDACDSFSYAGPAVHPGPVLAGETDETGLTSYHVSTVDELLAAIGDDTAVYLDEGLYDFSAASGYGGFGSDHYYWVDQYDGPSLVISGVSNFHIIGAGQDKSTLQAVPRYAEVLAFENCYNVSVEQLTAGHLKEAPGSCCGDVLEFNGCTGVLVDGCGLFGCGVYAVCANNCTDLQIRNSELYECSASGALLSACQQVLLENCVIRDDAESGFFAYDCRDLSLRGISVRHCGPEELPDGLHPSDFPAMTFFNCSGLNLESLSIEDCLYNALSLEACLNASLDGKPLKDGNHKL